MSFTQAARPMKGVQCLAPSMTRWALPHGTDSYAPDKRNSTAGERLGQFTVFFSSLHMQVRSRLFKMKNQSRMLTVLVF